MLTEEQALTVHDQIATATRELAYTIAQLAPTMRFRSDWVITACLKDAREQLAKVSAALDKADELLQATLPKPAPPVRGIVRPVD